MSSSPDTAQLPPPVGAVDAAEEPILPQNRPPAHYQHSGASPPLPPLPQERRISLSESLAQLQGEAAFVPRAPPQAEITNEAEQTAMAVKAEAEPPTEEDVEFFIPGLTARELFVRLPEHDPVSALLDKYLPPQQRPQRDLSGNWQGQTLDTLIASRNWRGTARYAYNAITQAPPEKTTYLLSHWLLRLHSLLRLRLIPQLASEVSAVFALLPPSTCFASSPSAFPPDTPRFHPAVPFDLHVLAASSPALQGGQLRAAEAMSVLIKSTKEEMWLAEDQGRIEEGMKWRSRAERLGTMLADLLDELKATSSAVTLLSTSTDSPAIHRSLARLHFSTGNTAALSVDIITVETEREQSKVVVLQHVAQGRWKEAEEELRKLVEEKPEDVEAVNNLAVVLLYTAKLDEAIALLSGLFSTNPSCAYNDETILFNLVTLFELRTEQAATQKERLLRSAAEFGAQGVNGGAFKLVL